MAVLTDEHVAHLHLLHHHRRGIYASGQNCTSISCAKTSGSAFSGMSPGTCTRCVSHGWLAHSFMSSSSSPSNSVTGAKKSLMCLSLSCITFSFVMNLKEGLPSVRVRTALCAFLRLPSRSTFSASVNAWAMLVKPFLYSSPSSALFTFAMSLVSCRMSSAFETEPSAVISPLPNCTIPIFMSSKPKYSPLYFSRSLSVKPLMTLKPSSWREPLASMDMMRSCFAMQISSPVQSNVLHFLMRYRYLEVSFGHLPFPWATTVTRRHFSV